MYLIHEKQLLSEDFMKLKLEMKELEIDSSIQEKLVEELREEIGVKDQTIEDMQAENLKMIMNMKDKESLCRDNEIELRSMSQ